MIIIKNIKDKNAAIKKWNPLSSLAFFLASSISFLPNLEVTNKEIFAPIIPKVDVKIFVSDVVIPKIAEEPSPQYSLYSPKPNEPTLYPSAHKKVLIEIKIKLEDDNKKLGILFKKNVHVFFFIDPIENGLINNSFFFNQIKNKLKVKLIKPDITVAQAEPFISKKGIKIKFKQILVNNVAKEIYKEMELFLVSLNKEMEVKEIESNIQEMVIILM
ncbi:hypothetical protein [Mesomycoplasma molare]|uniref:Uncharacterized protein n=1 Tax=Mesomycoplasma molare TaxID=171288 RepID=A0ABY5TTX0_9BACT|nr:hypothetical protein [Mesomycoplasma molare]UWD34112.1 hypothetical protein NX772_03420 [Mesomycoplasma molare]